MTGKLIPLFQIDNTRIAARLCEDGGVLLQIGTPSDFRSVKFTADQFEEFSRVLRSIGTATREEDLIFEDVDADAFFGVRSLGDLVS